MHTPRTKELNIEPITCISNDAASRALKERLSEATIALEGVATAVTEADAAAADDDNPAAAAAATEQESDCPVDTIRDSFFDPLPTAPVAT
jgi:hypothetical protein